MNLLETPLIAEHRKLGARLGPFGGWLMPIQYSGIIAEHEWTRKNVSLFDTCHMGRFILKGQYDRSGLDKIVTVNLSNMPIRRCRYGFMLNESGGIIDDLVTYKIKDDEWLLVVNAARIAADEAHLRKHLSVDSKLENASARSGKLDLQGPFSKDVLAGIAGSRISSLKYYTFGFFTILGEENIISRTGYTGELGYEIYISNGKVVELWDTLLKDVRVKPAGLGARDTLRLEMGYGLYGQDINASITPLEAGLEKFLDLDKDFIGKGAILEKKKKGGSRQMVYFLTDSRRAPRHNYKIFRDNKEIGIVTSGSFSPSLSCGIGTGYVKEPLKKGDKIVLCEGAIEINATLTDKPFYKHGTAQRRW